jgi:hypothetical protein
MAQYRLRSRWLGDYWRAAVSLAAKVLRDYEAVWLRSEGPFPVSEVVAVMLNVFAFDFHGAAFVGYTGVPTNELWKRSVEDWASSVDSPETECARLWPNRTASEQQMLVASFCHEISCAAESWERRSPDQPTCEETIERLADLLIEGRFVRLRYD